MMRFFALASIIVALSFMQAHGFALFGIKPNLALSALIALTLFMPSRHERILAASLAVFVLKSAPSDIVPLLSLLVVFFAVGEAAQFARMNWYAAIPIFSVLGSLMLYLLLTPHLLFSATLLKEAILNTFFAAMLYLSLAPFFSVGELKIRRE